MSSFVEYPLPTGWCWGSIESLTSYVQRGKSPKYVSRSSLPVVNQKCVRWHGLDAEHLKFVDPSQWDDWSPERTLLDGDILWNSTGTGTIGRAAVFRPIDGFSRTVADSHVTVVRVAVGPPEYLHSWIRSPAIQDRIDAMQTGSTNQVELGRAEVLQTRVPVAPLNEQHRIVAKLEELQVRNRRARLALEAVPPLLDKLRQSILAAAFRGELTADWRADQQNVAPATEMVARIHTERRHKWEAFETAVQKAKGKVRDAQWRSKYSEAANLDGSVLPELPEGWCWVSFDALAYDSLYGPRFSSDQYADDGFPTLRTTDLDDEGHIVWNDPPRIRVSEMDYTAVGLRPYDFVVTRTGATIGKCALHRPGDARALPSAYLIRFGLVSEAVDPEYTLLAMLSPRLQAGLRGGATATAQPNVNARTIGRLAVPIAPPAEQVEIVATVSRVLKRLASARSLCEAIESGLSVLERSMLAKAFRGELVPQDPNDEPAHAVLERLGQQARGPNKLKRPRKSRPTAEVSKSNGDRDLGQDLLAELLRQEGPLSPELLLDLSRLEIEDFYSRLKDEVDRGLVREKREGDTRTLEATQ